jgi:hypothetical protein
MSNAHELADLADLAANAIALAADLLGQAQDAVDASERRHAIPSGDQHAAIHFQTIANQLERVFEELTGAPRLTVLSSSGRVVRRISAETGANISGLTR